jgi:hypothetical protein
MDRDFYVLPTHLVKIADYGIGRGQRVMNSGFDDRNNEKKPRCFQTMLLLPLIAP